MNNMQGMDIQAVRRLGNHLAEAAGDVQHAIRQAEQLLHDANWIGQDREKLMQDWIGHRSRLLHAAQLLADAGRTAHRDADAQQRISAAGGGGGGDGW